jgi:hypothetical protein
MMKNLKRFSRQSAGLRLRIHRQTIYVTACTRLQTNQMQSNQQGEMARTPDHAARSPRLALRGRKARPMQSKAAEQLPSKEGSAYPFDLCKQKGNNGSEIKLKNLNERSAVLSDTRSIAQDGKICKAYFQKTFTFSRKNHQIFVQLGASFDRKGENGGPKARRGRK